MLICSDDKIQNILPFDVVVATSIVIVVARCDWCVLLITRVDPKIPKLTLKFIKKQYRT